MTLTIQDLGALGELLGSVAVFSRTAREDRSTDRNSRGTSASKSASLPVSQRATRPPTAGASLKPWPLKPLATPPDTPLV